FDPIGNYDWVHTDINIPNELFSNNVKTKEGDTGNGILDVFDRYNFTVKEDEPLEKDVAIDPELLGKAYEKFNAIRPDNFEEYKAALKSGETGAENKFNKKFGVYYTPREIVHYMCQQSLINYLFTCAEENGLSEVIKKQDIADLIEVGEMIAEHEATALIKQQNVSNGTQKATEYIQLLADSIRENAATIDRWLADITVCDPAVGSGAFPVGMMHEIVRARTTLSVFINDSQRNNYEFKRRCIEHSLYGVDIDPGAVEIAKLRLWLSLVVDEDDIKNIKPLPNLDYKVVCGNSLLGVEKNLFNNQLFAELEQLKPIYFNETNPTKKQEYKKQINELIGQITNGHTEFDFEVYFSEVFHEKASSERSRRGGFDVVIANPPYVQLQNAIDSKQKVADLYKNQNYETFERTGDIYCLFYEKGMQLLKTNGILTYITSNKWMRAGYGEKLREFFSRQNPLMLVDLGPNVFESATVDTNILLIQKATNQNKLLAATINESKKDNINIAEFVKQHAITLRKLSKDAWFIGSDAEQRLKEKIERMGKPLKEWDVNIYYGIKTGLNEAFIITTEKRDEILANCRDEDERKRTEAIIKPILRGRDIKRYYYEWAGLWVIFIPWHFPLHEDLSIQGSSEKAEKEFQKQYPTVYQHLLQFKDSLSKRNKEETGIRYEWYALQRCAATYYPEFEKEKVVYSEIVRQPQFYYDTEKFYVEATSFLMVGKDVKFICGLLNSKPVSFFFKEWYAGGGLGEEGYRYKKAFLENLPLLPITPANEHIVRQIESLADKILTAKKQNKNADTSEWEREIDRLVYGLYGLSEEDIRIVEKI
ncbi:MAG: TaqI-like C-terminal specificity domain-containing protein, partial [Bacteroidales bacterium]